MRPSRAGTTAIFCFIWILSCSSAEAQEPAQAAKDYIRFARTFLRSMYPDSGGNNYVMTVEGWVRYDQESAMLNRFSLYVGDAPKDFPHHYVGCMSTPPPIQLPTPPELAPPSPLPALPSDQFHHDCKPGPILPKQVLIGDFEFDASGRLSSYDLGRPGIRQLEQRNKFAEFVLSHPEMTDAEVVTALKKAGAKYGPEDKQQFIKNLPIQKLEPFLGKLQLISVTFQPLQDSRTNVDIWPLWQVKVQSKQNHRPDVIYEMFFEQFEGELTSLHILETSH